MSANKELFFAARVLTSDKNDGHLKRNPVSNVEEKKERKRVIYSQSR